MFYSLYGDKQLKKTLKTLRAIIQDSQRKVDSALKRRHKLESGYYKAVLNLTSAQITDRLNRNFLEIEELEKNIKNHAKEYKELYEEYERRNKARTDEHMEIMKLAD